MKRYFLLYFLLLQVVHAQIDMECQGDFASERKLNRGDLTVLDQTFQQDNVACLWSYFLKALARGWGKGRSDPEREEMRGMFSDEQIAQINRNIEVKAAECLKKHPDHADYLHRIIEEDMLHRDEKDANGGPSVRARTDVDRHFSRLAALSSPECVRVLMSYLDDTRQLGYELWLYEKIKPRPLPPANFQLVQVLWRFRNKEPWSQIPFGAAPNYKEVAFLLEELRKWWASPAAAAWGNGMAVKAPAPGGAGTAASGGASAFSSNPGVPVWLLITLCAGGIAAATLLAARKRRR